MRFLTLVLLAVPGAALAAEPDATALSASPADRYGPFGGLDPRSRYGQYWFPEPFRVDETDLDNEVRVDWFHREKSGHVQDTVKTEVEKSFALTTLELEAPYQRETAGAGADRQRTEGIGNISLGARSPFFQLVSADGRLDNTLGAALEVGIPSNSAAGKNAEIVPKLFDDLRIGEHLSIQAIVGDSFLLGSAPEGDGRETLEYGLVFGYAMEPPLRGIERIIAIFEMTGETALNKSSAGHNAISATAGVRINLDNLGPLQPRIGLGYAFPLDQGARDDFAWGMVTSIVFEY